MQHFEMHKKLPLIWRFRFRTAGEEDDPSHPFFWLIIHANIHMYIYIYIYKYYPEWRGPCFLPTFIRMLAQARCTTRCMSAFILCSTSEDGLPEGPQLITQTCAHVNTYEDTPVRDVWINAKNISSWSPPSTPEEVPLSKTRRPVCKGRSLISLFSFFKSI
jgi:hypothetical protein